MTGTPMSTVHAYNVRSVRRAVDAGVKCIEHGQLLDEATIRLLADKGLWLSLQVLDPAPPTAPENVRREESSRSSTAPTPPIAGRENTR